MLKTLNWNGVVSLHNSLVKEHKLEADAVIIIHVTYDQGSERTYVIKSGEFLKIMWKIFDCPQAVKSLDVVYNSTKIYEYEFNKTDETKPSVGETNIILNFKTMSPTAKSTHIDLLLSQIMESNYDDNSGTV